MRGVSIEMNIEPAILVAAPIGSIAIVVWVSLIFAKSQTAKRIKVIAYKLWAVIVIAIVSTVMISGLVFRLRDGSASTKIWLLALLGIGLTPLSIKFGWDLFIERK